MYVDKEKVLRRYREKVASYKEGSLRDYLQPDRARALAENFRRLAKSRMVEHERLIDPTIAKPSRLADMPNRFDRAKEELLENARDFTQRAEGLNSRADTGSAIGPSLRVGAGVAPAIGIAGLGVSELMSEPEPSGMDAILAKMKGLLG